METIERSNYFGGLGLFKTPEQILEATKAHGKMKSWNSYVKTLTSKCILDFVSGINKDSIDYCGSSYRRSFTRSSGKVHHWLSTWSSNNILKNACDMLEIWNKPEGISGVFITQRIIDRKEKRLSYWFYRLSSTGKCYRLSFIELSESSEMPVISAVADIEYDQMNKSLREVYQSSSNESKEEMLENLLGMILFKTYSTNEKSPRYIYLADSNFMINYYTVAKTLNGNSAPVKENEEVVIEE